MTKWNHKASVQTALVTGFFLIVLSMGGGLFSLYQDKVNLSREVDEKINEAVLNFSDNAQLASEKSAAIDITPNFENFDSSLETMRALNDEAHIYDTTVNLTEIYRYVRKHGTKTTQEQLGEYINTYSSSHQAANAYLIKLFKRDNMPGTEDTVRYVQLLNDRSVARANLHSYIMNLQSVNFEY